MKKIKTNCFVLMFVLGTSYGFSQTLNQSANWPNADWTLSGTFNPIGLLSDPTVNGTTFTFDDNGAGTGSEDALTVTSPVIDLTAASVAGETLITINAEYSYRSLGDLLLVEFYDAQAMVWAPLQTFAGNSSGSDYETCASSAAYTTPVINIAGYTATQLSGFQYRFSYFDGDQWRYGFCLTSPTITSAAICSADAGTLTADATPVSLSEGEATLTATEDITPTIPVNYEVTYVLTSGAELVIVGTAVTPSFVVDAVGLYTIHTLVALTDAAFSTDPNYVDLSALPAGTTGADVLGLIEAGLCASLDPAGAPITVEAEPLSIDDAENQAAFSYYPNPVNNTLTLNAQNTIEKVTMYNMLGQVVLRANPKALNSELNMSSLHTGTYFVKVTIENVTKTVRVIKQ